jgi:TonB family protein
VIDIKSVFVNIALLFTIYIHAQSVDNVKTVYLNCNQEPLRSVLEKIRIQTGVDFIYSNDLTDNIQVSCFLEGSSIENALVKILKPHSISYKIFNGKSFVLFKVKKPPQRQFKTEVEEQNYPQDTPLVNSEPQIITRKNLIYPLEAVRNGIEGDVTVKFLVTTEGNVKTPFVESSSGSPILDSATVAYAQTLKYVPAYNNSKPTSVWILLKFKYFITNK